MTAYGVGGFILPLDTEELEQSGETEGTKL